MNILETNREGEEGNGVTSSPPPKQSIQRLYYCTAIFNYDLETIKQRLVPISKKLICGEEICPSTGNLHWQTFIGLKKAMRMTELCKILPGTVWKVCKGDEESNVKYCSKDGKTIFKHGFPAPPKPLKLIEPSKPWQLKVLEILKQEPDDRKVYWFWSQEGGIGKSQFCKYCVVKENCLFFEEGKKADIMHLIFEAPEDRLERIIIDVPRDNGNNISYKAIESIKNGLIYSSKYEGGYKYFNSPHVIIFANMPPQEERLSADRWVIENIDE